MQIYGILQKNPNFSTLALQRAKVHRTNVRNARSHFITLSLYLTKVIKHLFGIWIFKILPFYHTDLNIFC